MNSSKSQANLYQIIDQVITTGIPVEIEYNGHIIKITTVKTKNKLSKLIEHPNIIVGDPEDFVHIDWSSYWTEEKNL